MSFDTPHGTRGARLPSKRLMNWINAFNMRRIRGKAPKVMGFPSLVLTTVGAKSGAPRHTPVAYFPDGPDSWLIVRVRGRGRQKPRLVLQPARAPRRRADPARRPDLRGVRRAAHRRCPRARVAPDHQHRKTFRGLREENRPRTAGHPPANPTQPQAIGSRTPTPQQVSRFVRND